MKKLLLGISLLFPIQLMAADKDSVYAWGAWAEGIKPAAGPVVSSTPAPADMPDVSFRPNENTAFARTPTLRLAPGSTGAPQVANTVIIPSNLPVISSGNNLNTGSSL